MSNPFYTYSGAFLPGILARAEAEATEFQSVQAGFAILAYQGTDTGAANAYVVATQGGKCGVYTDGLLVEFKAVNGNTSSCTISVDSGSTVGLTQPNGQSLASGALVANTWYRCMYNSTYSAWVVVAPTPATTITSNTISAAAPTNKVGLTAAAGVSTACIPIDITFAIDQSIAPTWTGAHIFSNTVSFNSTVTFSGGLSLSGGANQYAATLTGNSTAGQSLGLRVNAGTNASDFALRVSSQSAGSDYLKILGEGSIVAGSATGGAQGVGTINAVGLYVNGVAVSNAVAANPGTGIGLSTVNGTATTYMRSDGAPALSQAIAPTWTGNHIFTPTSGVAETINAKANSLALSIVGGTNTANTFMMQAVSAQASGFSSGFQLQAGTTSGDSALLVKDSTGTNTYLQVKGDGSGSLGPTSALGAAWAVTTGIFTFTPAAGSSFIVGSGDNTGLTLKNAATTSVGVFGTKKFWDGSGTNVTDLAIGAIGNMFLAANNQINPSMKLLGISAPTIQGWGPTASGLVDMTPDTGSFTLTSTGGPNLVCVWARVGNLVLLFIPTGTVSTGVTSWTATGLPSAIQPTRTQLLPFGPSVIEDNSVSLPGAIRVNASSGTVTFLQNNGSTWTTAFSNAGGVRGMLQVATVTYLLN